MFGLMGVARNGGQGASVPDPSAAIIALFGSGEKGWLYDFNDLTTFYSDNALTTAATVNATVGSIRDKSPNLLHATQVTSTARATLRGTPTGANLWTAYGTPGAGWVDSGSGVAAATASNAAMPTTTAATSGRVYRIRYTMTRTLGTLTPSMGGVSLTARSVAGTFEQWITASSTAVLTFTGSSTYSGAVSAIDVRDVSADAVTAPYALQADGVDDFYETASVAWGTDAVTMCLGLRKLTDTGNQCVVELSNTSVNPGTLGVFAPTTASVGRITASSNGTVSRSVTDDTSPPVISRLVTMDAKISTPILRMAINSGAYVTLATTQGTGNYGTYPFYFLRRGGASLPFTGLFCGGVAINRALTAGETSTVETWQAERTGVTL